MFDKSWKFNFLQPTQPPTKAGDRFDLRPPVCQCDGQGALGSARRPQPCLSLVAAMPDTHHAPLSHRSPLKSPAKASPLKADKLTLDAPPPPSQRGSPAAGKSQREPPVSHRTKTKKTKQKVQKSLHEASAARPSSPSSPNASPGGGSPKGSSPSAKQVDGADMSDEVRASDSSPRGEGATPPSACCPLPAALSPAALCLLPHAPHLHTPSSSPLPPPPPPAARLPPLAARLHGRHSPSLHHHSLHGRHSAHPPSLTARSLIPSLPLSICSVPSCLLLPCLLPSLPACLPVLLGRAAGGGAAARGVQLPIACPGELARSGRRGRASGGDGGGGVGERVGR